MGDTTDCKRMQGMDEADIYNLCTTSIFPFRVGFLRLASRATRISTHFKCSWMGFILFVAFTLLDSHR